MCPLRGQSLESRLAAQRSVSRARRLRVPEPSKRSPSVPGWHRGVYALVAGPLLLFTLMGWEEGGAITFGVPALIFVILASRPPG